MTVITVSSPIRRFTAGQRRELARTLTDAVLVEEVGQQVELAREGFQVHFQERAVDNIAIGGQLVADRPVDVVLLDVAVMDGHWPQSVRTAVINNLYAALRAATGAEQASPGWWVNFRVIDEGSWGSRGGVLSIHDILDPRAFTSSKIDAIKATTPRAE